MQLAQDTGGMRWCRLDASLPAASVLSFATDRTRERQQDLLNVEVQRGSVMMAVSRRLESFDGATRVAVGAVRDAIRLARSLEGHAQASMKADASPVAVADLAIQAVVAQRLARAFPHDPLIAEEDAALMRADPELSSRVVEVVRQIIGDATIDALWRGSEMLVQASVLDSGPLTRSTAQKAFCMVVNTLSRSR